MNGARNMWAITPEEREKHDKQFDTLFPSLGYISGDQARKFFLQSGLPSAVLADIWALADMNKDGKMDRLEFSIAMKLIKLKLQGQNLPTALPIIMKQPPVPAPSLNPTRMGMGSMQGPTMMTPMLTPMSMGVPMTSLGPMPGITPMGPTGMGMPMMPTISTPALPNGTVGLLQPMPLSGGLSLSGSFSSSPLGFSATPMNKASSLLDLSSSSNSSSTTSLASISPKTGPSDWGVPQGSRLKYRQQFNSLDKQMTGHLTGQQVRNVLSATMLSQTQLASIWNLADVNKDGKLKADEFILAMHLVDMARMGQPLPLALPADLIPPSLRGNLSDSLNGNSSSFYAELANEIEVEPPQKTRSNLTFEDKFKQNMERGNMELEKRRQALLDQQRREEERLAQKAREEQERRDREAREQELRRRREEEQRLERQREMERQREEERLKELERKEAAQKELERQRKLELELRKKQELQSRKSDEQEDVIRLRAKKRSLEMELEAVGNKHKQISDRLRDAQGRKAINRAELETVNQKRDGRITEINSLQIEFEEFQRKLAQLAPEQQKLNDKLRLIRINNKPASSMSTLQGSVTEKDLACRKLKEQLETLEKETAAKLADMEQYKKDIMELRDSQRKQQAALDKLRSVKEDKLRELKKHKKDELEKKRKEEDEERRRVQEERERERQERLRREEEERQRKLREERERAERAERERREKEEEERRRRKEEDEKREQERKRREEERRREEEEERKKREERRLAEEERRKAEMERKRLEEERRKLEEERKKLEEERRRKADEDRRREMEEEQRKREDERRRKEEERRQEEERKKEEQKRLENERRRREEERRMEEERRREREEEDRRRTRAQEAAKRDADERKKQEEERKRVEEERKKREEERRAQAQAQEQERRRQEEERKRKQQEEEAAAAARRREEASRKQQQQQQQQPPPPQNNAKSDIHNKLTALLRGLEERKGAGLKPQAAEHRKSAALTTFKALYPFSARTDEELSFEENDLIEVDETVEHDPGWLYGSRQGKFGWFPESYVEKQTSADVAPAPPKAALKPQLSNSISSKPSETSAFTPTMTPSSSSSETSQVVENMQAKALCSWTAKTENHLNFSKDDVITVLEQQDSWWLGELNGLQGWFPKSYVTVLSAADTHADGTDGADATDGSQQQVYVALYTYESPEPGDLTFSADDIILVTENKGEWWKGCIGDRYGLFPFNYVKPKEADTSSLSGKLGVKKPEIAQVMKPYSGSGAEQLTLASGQLIVVLSKDNTGWWLGELQARGKKRQKGWFPASHVKVLGSNSGKSTPAPAIVCQVIAMYDYTAANQDELSFSKSQLINVLDKNDKDWWRGEINGVTGLFPTNYVKMTTAESDPSQQWCADLASLDSLSPQERKRQGYIHELIETEQKYVEDLQLVLEVFHKPMSESGRLTEQEMGMIFVNWRELITCNNKFLKALRVRKKTGGDNMPVQMIGDILASELSHMQAYIRFCSCQLNGAALLQIKTDQEPEFKDFLKKIATDYRCKGMPLSSFLLKPMQRITRYPLHIKNILESTPESHPDHGHLREALEKAEELCSQVNEGVREKENSDRLEWIQNHVQCEGITENLVYNSLTNCLGPRKLLHSGRVFKTKSNKELFAFLFNDFLLLTHATKQFSSSGADKLFSPKSNTQFKMYKSPVFLNEVLVKMPSDPSSDEPVFHISHIDRVYTLKTENINERTAWVQKIKNASEQFIETEKKKREKAYQARSVKASGIGRLLVTVLEATELKSSKPNGKSNPYCEVTMGAQCYTSRTLNETVNPKWNFNCQFHIKDVYQDVLCITIFEREQFSPDDFLGRTEVPVATIKKELENKGPATRRLLLHEVPTGEVWVRLDLQLFDHKTHR